jgi:hypothetical protein
MCTTLPVYRVIPLFVPSEIKHPRIVSRGYRPWCIYVAVLEFAPAIYLAARQNRAVELAILNAKTPCSINAPTFDSTKGQGVFRLVMLQQAI